MIPEQRRVERQPPDPFTRRSSPSWPVGRFRFRLFWYARFLLFCLCFSCVPCPPGHIRSNVELTTPNVSEETSSFRYLCTALKLKVA
jgi:hypothetical protein